jgi:adenylate kinase
MSFRSLENVMKAIVFGQIGLRKKVFLPQAESLAVSKGKTLKVFNVGNMMYACDSRITRGRILQKKVMELDNIRARVFDDIGRQIARDSATDNFIINSHATFRWPNCLFLGVAAEEIQHIAPDLCITLIDDVHRIRLSLSLREQKPEHLTLKDIMVWREEEIAVADIVSSFIPGCENYVVAMQNGPELVYKLVCESHLPKVYLSYPISMVRDDPPIWTQITDFRRRVKEISIAFDPYGITESSLLVEYKTAKSQNRNRRIVNIRVDEHNLRLPLQEIEQVEGDIRWQIIMRDYRLIEQSDMIVAFIPEKSGYPVLSDGVTRELTHAEECTKETYIIWQSKRTPSPFTHATRMFDTVDQFCSFLFSLRR